MPRLILQRPVFYRIFLSLLWSLFLSSSKLPRIMIKKTSYQLHLLSLFNLYLSKFLFLLLLFISKFLLLLLYLRRPLFLFPQFRLNFFNVFKGPLFCCSLRTMSGIITSFNSASFPILACFLRYFFKEEHLLRNPDFYFHR